MTQKETSLEKNKNQLIEVLSNKYETTEIRGEKWHKIKENRYVHITVLFGNDWNCFVTECAYGLDKIGCAEDLDMYYPEDFGTIQELANAIIKDAESAGE